MPRRDLVARRSPARRWARRLLGVAATAVVLAVGYVAVSMILSPADDEVSASAGAEAAARERPDDERGERRDAVAEVEGTRRSGPSKRQRAQRRAAVAEVRGAGYEPIELADYDARATLRVLVGRPREGMAPGLRAFFFRRGRYLGNDALTPSMKLGVGRRRDREITLVYSLFVPGDRPCCPSGGDAKVRYRWTGDGLEPRDAIPPEGQRMPLGVG